MKPVSSLTHSINMEPPATEAMYAQALHQLQQHNTPSIHAQHIRAITMSYQTKPSMMHDGKDWARLVLQNPSEHHQLAVKWAREVLKGGE